MRTTISLDEHILDAVKRGAAEKGLSVSAYIASILDEAIKREREAQDDPPFRLITAGGGGPLDGVDLDRPRELMVADDERRYGK
jgi:hypothetical protein